jgi:ankyrin repeat protein
MKDIFMKSFNSLLTLFILFSSSYAKPAFRAENKTPDNTRLWSALASGEPFQRISLLAEQGKLNPRAQSETGLFPLYVAAAYNRPKLLKLLLKQPNIDVNQKNKNGKTALHVALSLSLHTEIIKILIEREDLKHDPSYLDLALEKAAESDFPEHILEPLLRKETIRNQVNRPLPTGETLLYKVLKEGQHKLAYILAKYGAHYSEPNERATSEKERQLNISLRETIERYKQLILERRELAFLFCGQVMRLNKNQSGVGLPRDCCYYIANLSSGINLRKDKTFAELRAEAHKKEEEQQLVRLQEKKKEKEKQRLMTLKAQRKELQQQRARRNNLNGGRKRHFYR